MTCDCPDRGMPRAQCFQQAEYVTACERALCIACIDNCGACCPAEAAGDLANPGHYRHLVTGAPPERGEGRRRLGKVVS